MPSWFKSSGQTDNASVEYDRVPLTSQVDGDSEDEEAFNGSTSGITIHLGKHHEIGRTRKGQDGHTYTTKVVSHRLSWKQKICFLAVIGICVGLVVVFYFGLPCPEGQRSWTADFPNSITESAVRLYDVNDDGVVDMIFGADREGSRLSDEAMEKLCKGLDLKPPCGGRVMVLDGKTGNVIHSITVSHEIFELNCGNVDLNGDGTMDCLASGRIAGLYAVDVKKGNILWQIDDSNTNSYLDIFQPLQVPDLDMDDIPDFVITHGGDVRFSSKERNRPPGRIMLISGATGTTLGEHLPMPDGRETYSSPVLYRRHNGGIYVLFGSGGETIKGSFWAISLLDLYIHTKAKPPGDSAGAPIPGSYSEPWGEQYPKNEKGFIEIFRSETEMGVMVPVVVADMNNDDVDDIIMCVFDGTIIVYDGKTLDPIWTTGHRFHGYQFYSIPALGYFNDDETLDVMVHLNLGEWEDYNLTMHTVLDGKTGEILWNLKSSKYTMSSSLVVKTGNHKDAFVFVVQGREGNIIDRQIPARRTDRHGDEGQTDVADDDDNDDNDDDDDEDGNKHLKDCEQVDGDFTGEVFLIDRDYSKTPIKILEAESEKIRYNIVYSNIMAFGAVQTGGNAEEKEADVQIAHRTMKQLSEHNRQIVESTMKHIPQNEIQQLHMHIQQSYNDISVSEDDIQDLMALYVIRNVLQMGDVISFSDLPVEKIRTPPPGNTQVGAPTQKPPDAPKQTTAGSPEEHTTRPPPAKVITEAQKLLTTTRSSDKLPAQSLAEREMETPENKASTISPEEKPTSGPSSPVDLKHSTQGVLVVPQDRSVATPQLRDLYKRPNIPTPKGHSNGRPRDSMPSRQRRHGDGGGGEGMMMMMGGEINKTVVISPDGDLCVRKSVVIRPTGAIGEIWGELYYFSLVGYATAFYDNRGQYIDSFHDYKTQARKVSLSDMIKTGEIVQLREEYLTVADGVHGDFADPTNPEEHFTFLPFSSQPWLGYMGTRGDGHLKER